MSAFLLLSLICLYNDLAKKNKQFIVAENHRHKKTGGINSVQSSLKYNLIVTCIRNLY